jgi:hypothetical protein
MNCWQRLFDVGADLRVRPGLKKQCLSILKGTIASRID